MLYSSMKVVTKIVCVTDNTRNKYTSLTVDFTKLFM